MSLRPSIAPPGDRDGNLDRVEFYGRDADGRVMRIVTKLDDVGNVYADLSEVTVLTGVKKNNLPPLMSLREVVEAAQERDALPTVNAGSIPNSGANGNQAKFAVGPSALGDGKQKYYEVPFGTAVDKIVKAKKPIGREAVFVSETPKAFRDVGIPALPVMMNQDHVLNCYFDRGEGVKSNHLHGLHLQLKMLPQSLQRPMMIIASQTSPKDCVVAIVKIRDRSGNNVIVPVEIGGRGLISGGHIDANIAKTAFGKKNLWSEIVAKALRDESDGKIGIFHVDKNEANRIKTLLAREAFDASHAELQSLGMHPSNV